MIKRGLLLLLVSVIISSAMLYAQADEHPRLFFSQEDIPRLRQEAQTTHKDIWDAIKYYADRLPDNCAMPNDYYDAGNVVFVSAFAYVITGEATYLDKARECMMVNADPDKWPYWDASNTRDLNLADMLVKNSLAYDWLYNNMTQQERDYVRAGLVRHATEMLEAADYNNTSWSDWWKRSWIQNHFTTNNAGLGLTALAIDGELGYDPKFLSVPVSNFKVEQYVLESIGEGTWHEGFNYQSAEFTPLPFLINLERIKGTDLIPEDYYKNYINWMAYNYLPGSEQPVFPIQSVVPDWGWDAALNQVQLRYLANRYDNGLAEWLAEQILKVSTRDRYKGYHAPGMIFEFLYYNASVNPVPPDDLSTDAYYPDIGIVTWRTGWGDDDLVFGLKSTMFGGQWASDAFFSNSYPFDMEGSNANVGHDHADANTFYLYMGGTDLSSERPHRQTYDQSSSWKTTSWHNTVIVDGKNQFMFHNQGLKGQPVGGQIREVETAKDFDYLAADATGAYRNSNSDWDPLDLYIQNFTRYVMFVRPYYLVMVDNLRSAQEHKYEWIAHIGPAKTTTTDHISVSGNWIKGIVDDDVLGINVLAPEPFSYSKGISSCPDSGQAFDKAYVRVSPQGNVADTRFITILYPTTGAGWDSRPETELLGNTEYGAGVRVHLDTTQDSIFRYWGSDSVAVAGYILDGDAAGIIRGSDGKLQKLFVVNARSLSDSGTALFQSAGPLTVEAAYSGSSLALYGDYVENASIYAPGVDKDHVTINGSAIDVSVSGDYVVIGEKPCITIKNSELNNYINNWRNGAGISIKQLLNMIDEWKTGC